MQRVPVGEELLAQLTHTRPPRRETGPTLVICDPRWQSTPDHSEAGQAGRLSVDAPGASDGNPELVLAHRGGDVGVGLGSTSGFTRSEMGATVPSAWARRESSLQLGLALHVVAAQRELQRRGDLQLGLSDAAEDGAADVARGLHHPRELAEADHVEAAALGVQQRQHAQVAQRLHREADQIGPGRRQLAVTAEQLGAAVDVHRRADVVGDLAQRDALAEELARAAPEP